MSLQLNWEVLLMEEEIIVIKNFIPILVLIIYELFSPDI